MVGAVSALLLAGVAAAAPRFAAPFLSYPSGFDAHAVAVDYLNYDARPDVVILSSLGLEIRLGEGYSLGPATVVPVGVGRLLLVFNPNRDGFQDVLVSADSLHVGVLIGNGDGTFQPMVTYPVAKGPVSAFINQIDDNDSIDLVCVCETDSKITVLLGDGHGGFNTRIDTPVAAFPTCVAPASLDNDGDLDLLVSHRDSPALSRLLGNGAGGFTANGTLTLPGNAGILVGTNLNSPQDFWPDAVCASTSSAQFFVLPGLAGGGFGPVQSHATADVPSALAVGYLDGNSILDIVLLDSAINHGEVRRGLGSFAFAAAQPFSTPRDAWGVAVGDLDGAGKGDVVTIGPYGSFAVHMGNGDGTFGGVADVTVGTNPWSVACGDLNEDDHLDLVTANSGAGTLTVRFGDGSGAFGAPLTLTTGVEPHGITIADVEGDGDLDLIVAENGPGTQTQSFVSVFLGDGSGSFAPRVPYAVARWAQQVAVGNLDGDTLPDLAVACMDLGTVSILKGFGNGLFGNRQDFPLGTNGSGVAIADVTRDGKPDVLLADYGSGTVQVLPGNANGTYLSPFGMSVPLARGVAAAEVAGDSAPDLIVSSNSGLSVFASVPGGGFSGRVDYPGGSGPLAIADFDADGRTDVATANNWPSNSVSVWMGQPGGGLATAIAYGGGDRPFGVATGDVNGDQLLDLVSANLEANSVSLLLNTGGLPWHAWVGVPPAPNAPAAFELHAAPNPANGPGTIRYTLARPARVRLRVLDVAGRQLALLDQGERPAGRQSVRWNARGLRAGIGFLELQVDAERVVRRVAIVH